MCAAPETPAGLLGREEPAQEPRVEIMFHVASALPGGNSSICTKALETLAAALPEVRPFQAILSFSSLALDALDAAASAWQA